MERYYDYMLRRYREEEAKTRMAPIKIDVKEIKDPVHVVTMRIKHKGTTTELVLSAKEFLDSFENVAKLWEKMYYDEYNPRRF